MSIEFTAIDVETANESVASICAIGLAAFEGGQPVREERILIDPNDYFCEMNVMIHGISEADVAGSPTFCEVAPLLQAWLDGTVVVHHSPFDRIAVTRAWPVGSSLPSCRWLDTARVARRAWPDSSHAGVGLAKLSARLGIELDHHEPLSDARAAGTILVRACEESGLDVDGWLERVERPIDPTRAAAAARNYLESCRAEGNPEGPLFGEVLVFTGTLHIPRREATQMAAAAGCQVKTVVSKMTTILVVGDQDMRALVPGSRISTKHAKAEELVRRGHPIRILRESDFEKLMEGA